MAGTKQKIWEDVWIPTQCARCYNDCAIKVRRVNGVAVEVQGEPDSTHGSMGGVCAKSVAGLQVIYDPNRLTVPLKRTNPEKGIGVDPKWKEITWEEAYNEIVPRLKKALEGGPKKVAGSLVGASNPAWTTGAPNYLSPVGPWMGFIWGGGLQCGGASHPTGGILHGSWSIVPDFKYCNYVVYVGASKGHAAGHSAMITARMAAEARARGMKMVVLDPMCRTVAGKATEWLPVIPGTDGAIILAMCNVIVNELGIIDEPFLKLKTNAPYLVGPDMKYVREKGPARGVKGHRASQTAEGAGEEITYIGDDETNKPMVWDTRAGQAKVFDDPTIEPDSYALSGTYEYRGIKCQPSFALLKEHLKQYTPDMASKVSTVPAETIHRIAVEFATEARVGSTITIQGHTLPYRPVSCIIFRGGEGHGNSYHTCFAVNLLSAIVGAVEVPGGTTGWPARTLGYPGREDKDPGGFKWSVFKGLDGFLQSQRFGPQSGKLNKDMPGHGEWPIPMPEMKGFSGLMDIQPAGRFKYIIGGTDRDEVWEKLGATYKPEVLFLARNPLMAIGDRDGLANALKSIPFVVIVELFNTETTEGFADIVLPDTQYLEKDSWHTGLRQNFNQAWGMDDWSFHITQTVVPSTGQRKHSDEIAYDIAVRLGEAMGRNIVREANETYLKQSPINKEYWPADLDRQLTAAELGDAFVKSQFGPERDWKWFKERGFIRWPKRVEEAYWMWFLDLRIPVVYMEWLAHMKPFVEDFNRKTGLFLDPQQYTPLISWYPATIHQVKDPQYDLYVFSYRDVLHAGSQTMEQPWLDEASRMNPWTYHITMNADTGKKKGLKDGDLVELETYLGRKEKGIIKLVQGHHPLTVGIAATAGHFARGMPIAMGKGANFDSILPLRWECTDPVSGNMECSVRVKVTKIADRKG